MNERILGYLFIISGILIMASSVYLVYAVFTNQIKPYLVFQETAKTKDMTLTTTELMKDPANIAQMQKDIVTEVLEKQINKSLNVGSTIFLMYFIMLFGFRVSSLGVQLVRPIYVNLREGKNNPKHPEESV